jgi:hypothetical protein
VTNQPECPDCRTPVQPTWDWCMACGYDPEWLKPAGWKPGPVLVGSGAAAPPPGSPLAYAPAPAPVAASPRRTTSGLTEARPQEMTDPDWVPVAARERMSYVGVIGLVAAIVIAVGGLILVMVLVLNRPIGTTQANAAGLSPAASVSDPVAAEAG